MRIGEPRQAAREVGAVDVPHLGPLRLEVLLVLLGDRGDHRHPPHHGEAVALEPDELGRVVGISRLVRTPMSRSIWNRHLDRKRFNFQHTNQSPP